MNKKIISLILSLVLVFSTMSQVAFAKDTNSQRQNFNLISNTFDNIEYTYNENGKSYKVKEKSNSDFSQTYTEIYLKNDKSEYDLLEKFNTTITLKNKKYFEISQIKNGKKSVQILSLTDICKPINKLNKNQLTSLQTGKWEFNNINYGSTRLKNYTYSIVAGIITGIATAGLGTVPSSVISSIVGIIISENIPIVYYEQIVYYYREDSGAVTKVRVVTRYFYDKGHCHYIDSTKVDYDGLFPW